MAVADTHCRPTWQDVFDKADTRYFYNQGDQSMDKSIRCETANVVKADDSRGK